ncbi:MAG: aldo/keto reductase, partial [Chlorobiales bacterium]|nr:aldo/keto reductase [Chlorobiales bacterium]
MKPNFSLNTDMVDRSRLGFGCAYLTGGIESKKNIKIVQAALDAGIRHFDVAPLYGLGTAEDVLGRAIVGRRSQVTLATKVGRPRPQLTLKMQLLRLLASPVRAYASSLLRGREAKSVHTKALTSCFDLPFVQKSLDDSLRRLQTDYVDVFLLHEACAEDITDELLGFLEKGKCEGRFRAYGVASRYENIVEIEKFRPDVKFDVVQYSWSVLDLSQSNVYQDATHITHRAIMRAFVPLKEWFKKSPDSMRRMSDLVGLDLSRDEVLSAVLLGAALYKNSEGVVLFGSRRVERVRHNASTFSNEKFLAAGRLLI